MTDKPLSEYIDMEAYDVVPASQYRELKEQLEALEQRNDELLTRVTERVPVDYVEGLKGQLEALQAGLVRARLNHDISEHVYREILGSNPAKERR